MAADPFIVALRPQRAWSTLVAWDLFLSGTGAGLFFLAAILRRAGAIPSQLSMLSSWLGLALVAAGGIVLLYDLGVPSGFLRVFRRPRASSVSRGAWTMLLFCTLGALSLLPSLPALPSLAWHHETPIGTLLEAIVMVLAFFLMTYTGLLLSSYNSIPFWNTPLLPALFLVSSLTGGTGAMVTLAAATGSDTRRLGHLALFLVFAVSFHLLLYLSAMKSGPSAARESVRLLLSGEKSRSFTGGVLWVGLLLPFGLFVSAPVLGLDRGVLLVISGIAMLIGTFQLRSAILRAGVFRA